MGKLKTIIFSALVATLMLSNTGSVLAAEPSETSANIFGEVVAIEQVIKQADSSEAFIDLKTDEGLIRFRVTAATQYRNGSFADLAAGKRLALVAREADGTLVAEQLLIIPVAPRYEHLVGTVTSVAENRINASDRQNKGFAFEVQPNVSLDEVEPGQCVTAVIDKAPILTKLMAVRVVTKEGEYKETGSQATSSDIPTTTEKAGPEEANPPASVREVWLDLPSEQIKEVWIDLPPEQPEEVRADTSPEQTKGIQIDPAPELAKEIWMNLPPEIAKQVWMNLPPEIAKEIYIEMPAPEAIEAPPAK